MSVVRYTEVTEGRGANQKFSEDVRCRRTFVVTIDDPETPVSDIANACPVGWLDPHPEFSSVVCTEIACDEDGDPLHYKVVFTYGLVKQQDQALLPWERQPKFSYSGGVTSGPAIIHYNDGFTNPKFIVNSAGQPLEGASKEQAEWKVSISVLRQTFDRALAMNYLNSVNSDAWSGCAPGTLKCQGISGNAEVEQVNGGDVEYWSITAELAYRPEGWRLQLWDVGRNELVGSSLRPILNELGEHVTDNVALSNGQAMPFGSPPKMLEFKVYREVPFAGAFPVLP